MAAYHHALDLSSRLLRALLVSTGVLLSMLLESSPAQMTLDGSLGPRGALRGPNYTIPASVGQLRGSNLFHSFGQFNLSRGESATFTGPNTIANILSRVTGGSPSSIDGTIRSQIPGANLYLLNPSGVLFGPNASLDVSGSFHVSTADYLRFADGARFSAHLSDTSVLTVAPPAAFGFLGPMPAAIMVQGSTLQVPEGNTVALVGGDMTLTGKGSLPADGVPTLGAPGGQIHLVSVAAAGEVPSNFQAFTGETVARLGRVALSQGAFLDASGDGGGTVRIRSGRLLVDQAFVFADNRGRVEGKGLGVDLGITEDASFTNGAAITTDSLGAGRARDLRLTAGRVSLDDARIGSRPSASGDGGNVLVQAETLTLKGGSLSTATLAGSGGNAGSLTVQVGTLALTDGAQISSSTRGAGQGGTVTVAARDTITLAGQSSRGNPSGVFSNALAGTGGAGMLSVTAPQIEMAGGLIQANSAAASSGNAGSIRVEAGTLTLTGGAQISSDTSSAGQGGTVTVAARDTLTLTGRASAENRSGVFARAREDSSGNAGALTVHAGTLVVTDGARISSSTEGTGQGGTVTVLARDTLTLAAGGLIAANSLSARGGDAGSIRVEAGTLTLTEGGQIVSSTEGTGQGGTVTIAARDTLTLAGQDSQGNLSGVFATAREGSSGNAGALQVEAGTLVVRDGAQISSSSSTRGAGQGGTVTVLARDTLTLAAGGLIAANSLSARGGDAGSIRVEAGTLTLTEGGQIVSSTEGTGQGGTVTIAARDTLTLTGRASAENRSGVFARAREDSSGNAGALTVHAGTLVVTDGARISSSTEGTGQGGTVTVLARDTLTLAAGGLIAANSLSARGGDAGSIRVEAGTLTLTEGGQIVSSTEGTGQGGTVTIAARDTLTLAGRDSAENRSGVFARAREGSSGNAGALQVEARTLVVTDGAQISSSTFGTGQGGTVTVLARDTLTLAAGGLIAANSLSARGGDAGSIRVEAGTLTLTEGALISSSTFGAGQGGTITVTTADTLSIAGSNSGLRTTATGSGVGGDITLQAQQVRLTADASISAESTGTRNAGNITITVGDTFLSQHSKVTTAATRADGGNIQITAPNFLRLRDSRITAEVGGGPQTVGGNISIDPQFVILQNSQIIANAFQGQGGNIRIQAQQVFLADPASLVSASSALGINGQVAIQAPVTSISGAVAPLPQAFAQTAELLRTRCVERLREGRISRLVVGGRDGVPLEPGSLLLSPLERVGQEGGVQEGEHQSPRPAAPPGRAEYAQAPAPGGLEVECVRWQGQHGTTVTQKRRK